MERPARHSVKGQWSAEDLGQRLCHALDIAKRAVNRLGANGFNDRNEPGNRLRPEKVLAETSFLLLHASVAVHYQEVEERIHSLAQQLIPYARGKRMLLGVCLEPALALEYAQAHICLTRLGYPDADFDAALRRSLGAQAHAGKERLPHRMLEQDWLERTWDATRASFSESQSAIRNSALGRPMDLLYGTRDDVYAFTHALMYVADSQPAPRWLPRSTSELLAEAEAALGRAIDEQDYDLAGEVLLAWPLTGSRWSAAASFSLHVLARVEDQAGFLPSPCTKLQRLNELQGDERSDYLLATAYHTAYVMGLLCAACLRENGMPAEDISRDKIPTGGAAKILPLLDAAGCDAHWRVEFANLTRAEQDAMAGFLLAIVLRRKAIQRDFTGLREALAAGYECGVAGSPAASQAAELLERVAAAVPRLAGMRKQQQASLKPVTAVDG